MAFFSKAGNILKQTASRQINSELSASRPSIYQAIRCMSSSKLFVGGISYATDDISLREAFGKYGEVIEARVILDRETGRSRGFGFITFTSSEAASSAIQALDGQDLHGRRVRVNYANDRYRGTFGGGGGGDGYGGGGSYGSGGYGGGSGSYGGGGYGGGNYGGGGAGGSSYGGSSGGYGNDSNYGGSGGNYGGGNPGGNVGFADNTSSGNWNYGSNVTSESDAGSYGVAGGADNLDDMGGGSDGNADKEFGKNGSGDLDAEAGPLEGNFREEDADDFAKRA